MSEDAALRASKIYYHLDELKKALSYALLAGPLFDASEDFDYVHAILAKAIDEYGILKARAAELNQGAEKVDPRLESFLERMLWKCILDQKYQAIGIAIVKRQNVALMQHELGIFPERHEVFHKTCTKKRRTSDPKKILKWHRKGLQNWKLKSR
ncbi:26S proteasome non-ATPase regulatory subunit 1 homolog A-like isoform X1 [Papaver somniferum]|uniref:26S proteasome non-ATPase regulatory subunit 1 homolog A-like isoform X1 n=1 Tax=Papaver somniferum TaxID=3469 RepID=UPI000E6F9BC7|nr:26S proteasome non-ATPase regulatory subunit 1 homolog A-like isoform X1 [Papaver somniferum]